MERTKNKVEGRKGKKTALAFLLKNQTHKKIKKKIDRQQIPILSRSKINK